MKNLKQFTMTAALFLTATTALAQSACPSVQFSGDHDLDGKQGRAVVVVDHAKTLSKDGPMDAMDELVGYAQNHLSANGGTFLVFRAEDGSLHRLDSIAVVTSLKDSCAPEAGLKAKMAELHGEQKPLDAQMHDLSAKMKQAQSSEERAALGRRMGELGEQMGAIGRKQGDIGRQQGEFARGFHQRIQALIDSCLRDGSCPAVTRS